MDWAGFYRLQAARHTPSFGRLGAHRVTRARTGFFR